MSGTLFGLGVGPGDPELLTLKALRCLRSASVVAYPAPEQGASFARSIVSSYLKPEQVEIPIRMPLTSNRFPAREVYDRATAEIAVHLDQGRDVAAICEGDPFLYGSFTYLFERLAGRYPVQIVPGVASPFACAAAAAMPLVTRNQVLTLVPAPLQAEQIEALLRQCEVAAIMKLGRHVEKVRRVIEALGLVPHARYVERATTPEERVLPLEEAPRAAAAYFSMILVRRPEEHHEESAV